MDQMLVGQMLKLADEFRERGRTLEGYQVAAFMPWEEAADELAERIERFELDAVVLKAAAAYSGYTVGHLRRMLGLEPGYPGVIPNAGTAQEPRILHCNLPRKPGHNVVELITEPAGGAPTATSISLAPDPASVPNPERGVADLPRPAAFSRMQVACAVAAGEQP